MAKNKLEELTAVTKPETDMLDTMETNYTKVEMYIEENQKSLGIIVGVVVAIVAGYFAFQKFYSEPKEVEAAADMFQAEQYFAKDSLNKAIKGDGINLGFEQVIEEYGFTKSANLAHYYLGVSYLKQGKFEDAIAQLEDFDSSDEILGPIAIGAIGDAKMELSKTDEAIDSYLKAANKKKNKFTSPIYLMKAGLAYESKKEYTNALKTYEIIKSDYPETNEGRNADKYIARAKLLTEN
ncbi:MAG: tetratricopeptide repeat protein [Bacteroidia bacterium]|nr:tetratricopeptide repeat protein [Bacteroidia bacterium]